MSNLISSSPSIPAPLRDRSVDHCPTRKLDSIKMTEMAELCRPDQGEVEQSLESAIPTPVGEEQITRPYPDHVYVRMMAAANKGAHQAEPASTSQRPPERKVTLPGMRSARSNLMELVVLVAGAIALPATTLATFRSFADVPLVSNAAAVGNPKDSLSAKLPGVHGSSSSVAPRSTTASVGDADQVPAKTRESEPSPAAVPAVGLKSAPQESVSAADGHRSVPSRAPIKSAPAKNNKRTYEIED
jgi:hypothetical protein